MRPHGLRSLAGTLALCFVASTAAAQQPMFKEIPESEANVPPRNWKAEMLQQLQQLILDPTSIRDATVSPPALRFMGVAHRYVACLRFNAKNSYGGYTGINTYAAVFVRGTLSGLDTDFSGACRGASYTAFPEISAIK